MPTLKTDIQGAPNKFCLFLRAVGRVICLDRITALGDILLTLKGMSKICGLIKYDWTGVSHEESFSLAIYRDFAGVKRFYFKTFDL